MSHVVQMVVLQLVLKVKEEEEVGVAKQAFVLVIDLTARVWP
ncbi:MAG TPA: hypothetical protein VE544_00495 [Nitrososphaeraceae archaeon]|jgi:hypothetical protein|nr:hypothetical protein [Nitrososphaeraceae archaeon]